MAELTIARLFETSASAHAAVAELEAAGFPHDKITYMGNLPESVTARDPIDRQGIPAAVTNVQSGAVIDDDDIAGEVVDEESGAATGATLGIVVGGGAALLAGLGAIAIPGIGPLVAAGWLISTIAGAGVGAAAGGLLGALTTAGLGSDHAETYTEGVRRGGHLVALRTDDSRAGEVEGIMSRHMPIDVDSRQADWRSDGWDRPTPVGVPTVDSPMARMPPAGFATEGTERLIGSVHPTANDPTRPDRGSVA